MRHDSSMPTSCKKVYRIISKGNEILNSNIHMTRRAITG